VFALALGGTGDSSEEADTYGENAEEPTEGESGGVGRVVAKPVVSIRASASKLISGTLRGLAPLTVCSRFKSSSEVLDVGWWMGARNSEDSVLKDRAISGPWVFLMLGSPGAVVGRHAEEPDCGPMCEEAGRASSGESMGRGLCDGSDAGVRGAEDSLLGRSIVVTGASTLTFVGA